MNWIFDSWHSLCWQHIVWNRRHIHALDVCVCVHREGRCNVDWFGFYICTTCLTVSYHKHCFWLNIFYRQIDYWLIFSSIFFSLESLHFWNTDSDDEELSPPLFKQEIKDGQWMGVTVRSQGLAGKVKCDEITFARGKIFIKRNSLLKTR